MRGAILCAAAIVSFLLCGCVKEDADYGWEIPAGADLPSFSVRMCDGMTVSSADLYGHAGVIVFFHTGCPDCRRELPEVQRAYDACAAAGKDIRFLCIAREEEDPEISGYWQVNGLTLPYSPQPDREVYSLFASSVIPRIYVVSPDLRIAFSFSDRDMPSADMILSALDACGMDPDY